MKPETKNYSIIVVSSILILIGIQLFTTQVSAQIQGYQRDPAYKNLSGSGNNSGDASGGAGNTSLPMTPSTGNSNISNTNLGNAPALGSPITVYPHQVYHPDENYDKWAAQAAATYEKYGGEGSDYESAMKALNIKYFGQEIALPPASYYSTEYTDPNASTPKIEKSNPITQNSGAVQCTEKSDLNGIDCSKTEADICPDSLKLIDTKYGRGGLYAECWQALAQTQFVAQDVAEKYLSLCPSSEATNYGPTFECELDSWQKGADALADEYTKIYYKYNTDNIPVGQEPVSSDIPQLPPATPSIGVQVRQIQDQNTNLEYQLSNLSPYVDHNKYVEIIQEYKSASTPYYNNGIGGSNQDSFDRGQMLVEQKFQSELKSLVDDALQTQAKDHEPQEFIPVSKTITDATLTENNSNAQKLGLASVQVDFESSLNSIKIYSPGTLPILGTGDVLVRGPSATTVIDPQGTTGKVQDTYYVVNKYALPEGYVLEGAGEINTGGIQKTGGPFDLPVLDANNVPVYNLALKENALANDARQDTDGVFKYDFNQTPIADNTLMRVINSILTTVTSNDAIMGNIAMKQYSQNADVLLTQFGDYGRGLSKDLSEQQIERSVYDYVNNTIKYADPSASAISLQHTLEQAVASGQGVCRDKATALEYGLEAAGISAARVITPAHVFVAVLNSDGSVNHYLDPMYYENYVSLQRTNISPGQIIHNNYHK